MKDKLAFDVMISNNTNEQLIYLVLLLTLTVNGEQMSVLNMLLIMYKYNLKHTNYNY